MTMAREYDIESAFAAIEDELIDSMMRNMKRHRVEEVAEDKQWEMWQALQLKALEEYKKKNKKKFASWYSDINGQIEDVIREARNSGQMEQEIEILKAIQNGFKGFRRSSGAMQAEFFRLNERKLEVLIKSVTDDMKRAETAILRMANDQYRKAIFNAQVYANSGAGTYEKAVDMATKDMLSSGLNCIEYANGARHTLKDYADMAIRTASKRAYLQGEGEMRQSWGISTVIMNKRGNPCPKCLPFCGKVLIDEVWSGGSSDGISPVTGIEYPLMSNAIDAGLYHPRCKDSHTTYFEGVNTPPDDTYTKEELNKIADDYREEQKQQYARRQAEKFERLAKYSLDDKNQEKYQRKADSWKRVRLRTGDNDSTRYAESKRPLVNFHAVPQEKVVDILRRESEEWILALTDGEKRAIRKYTYNSGDKKPNRFFERLNAMLRGDIPEDKKLRNYADTISMALRKNKLQHDVIAYRGSNVDPTEGIPINGLYRAKQFLSTSVVKGQAIDGTFQFVIYVKKNSDAAYIENVSCFKKQRELLLDKDCIYRVLSRKDNVIELEVI